MRFTFVLVMTVAAVAGCSSSPMEELPDSATIRWGKSFGECVGYCREHLEVTRTTVRLTRSGWDTLQYPAVVAERVLEPGAWQQLMDTAGQAPLDDLDEVYGCPDCADGGAEWVEVEAGGSRQRVTFEYGRGPPQVDLLVQNLRSLRELFPAS